MIVAGGKSEVVVLLLLAVRSMSKQSAREISCWASVAQLQLSVEVARVYRQSHAARLARVGGWRYRSSKRQNQAVCVVIASFVVVFFFLAAVCGYAIDVSP